MPRILVITDVRERGSVLLSELRRADHVVRVADRDNAIEETYDLSPELIIVDASDDGTPARICRRIRGEKELKDLPLLVLVAEAHLHDLSPRCGLDDFATMPLRAGEAAARVRQLLWRTHKIGDDDVVQVRDMVINLASYEVTVKGAPVVMTYKEYELLKFLATNPGRVFTRENLLNRVWGYDFYGGTRTVDVHIRRIRSKIGDQHESLIQTVRNVGYRFSSSSADGDTVIATPAPA